ncbi:MAG TPA: tetratricopeptide repeat protein [Candidatus Eisenbacteria bacterium]|jgi:tetratricopeptide (TPR) repeat protein
MSFLPTESSHGPFDTALRRARAGHYAEAVAAIESHLAGSDAGAQPAADTLAEIARLAQAAGDLEAAASALGLAVRARPRHADLQYRYACALLRLERPAEARTALDRALEINPRYLAARVERAQLDAREGRPGEALGTLRALSHEASFAESEEFRQGLGRLDRGEWEEAQALFGQALDSETAELRHRLERFEALMREGDAGRAVVELHQAIAEHPAYPDLHARLGRAEMAQGHWDDAAVSFARALELNPGFHDARVELARALGSLGMRAQAMDQLGLVLEHEPANERAKDLQERWGSPHARAGHGAERHAKEA